LKVFPRRYVPYRLFDKFNPHWDNYDRKKNATFVGLVLGDLNNQLREHGFVTLNMALQALGFGGTESNEGDYEGWVYEPDPRYGDGYITFGVWDDGFAAGMDWLEGRVDVIKLRFNVDRVPLPISMQMKKEKEANQ
jgi:hypothetical protein